MLPKVKPLIIFLVMGVAACSTTHPSRNACTEDLARDRGAIAGSLAGSVVGDSWEGVLASVVGGLVGAEIGGAISTANPTTPDDNRPYKHNVFTGCTLAAPAPQLQKAEMPAKV
jgi:phage tail tape-measure protein